MHSLVLLRSIWIGIKLVGNKAVRIWFFFQSFQNMHLNFEYHTCRLRNRKVSDNLILFNENRTVESGKQYLSINTNNDFEAFRAYLTSITIIFSKQWSAKILLWKSKIMIKQEKIVIWTMKVKERIWKFSLKAMNSEHVFLYEFSENFNCVVTIPTCNFQSVVKDNVIYINCLSKSWLHVFEIFD